MFDLSAAELGAPVAQMPPQRGLFGAMSGGARDFHVQLLYPTGPGPGAGSANGATVRPLPLLIYFPGWPGDRRDNIGLLQDLAGHGYLVAAVTYDREDRRLRGDMDFSTDAAAENTLWRARTKLSLQARDAGSLLDVLERLNAHDPGGRFEGRLVPGSTAIFGYSFGGAVAAEACAHDTRFRAALNLDGWLFGDGAKLSFAQPYFLMSDDDPDPTAEQLASSDAATRIQAGLSAHDIRQVRQRLGRPGGYLMTILGTGHGSFSDVPAAAAAPVPSIIRVYAKAFFDKVLKGEPAPLLMSTSSPYRQVRLSRSALAGSDPTQGP